MTDCLYFTIIDQPWNVLRTKLHRQKVTLTSFCIQYLTPPCGTYTIS